VLLGGAHPWAAAELVMVSPTAKTSLTPACSQRAGGRAGCFPSLCIHMYILLFIGRGWLCAPLPQILRSICTYMMLRGTGLWCPFPCSLSCFLLGFYLSFTLISCFALTIARLPCCALPDFLRAWGFELLDSLLEKSPWANG